MPQIDTDPVSAPLFCMTKGGIMKVATRRDVPPFCASAAADRRSDIPIESAVTKKRDGAVECLCSTFSLLRRRQPTRRAARAERVRARRRTLRVPSPLQSRFRILLPTATQFATELNSTLWYAVGWGTRSLESEGNPSSPDHSDRRRHERNRVSAPAWA